MRILFIFIAFLILSGCDAFKLAEMGNTGQKCFNDNTCIQPFVCIEGTCENIETSDQNDAEETDNNSAVDQDDLSDTDDIDDSDTAESGKCNFGELCWEPVPSQQTRCFSDSGYVTCPESGDSLYGQDGNYSAGKDRLFENLNISGKYFVMDNQTELMWSKTSSETTISFDDAETFCQALNNSGEGGKFNWRLPYLHELVSIVNFDAANEPMTDGFYFTDVKKGKYWTLTKLGYENYYYVDFSGESQFYTDDHDTGSNYAICVSSEHNYDTGMKFNRWVELYAGGDTMVEDKQTGLIWQKVTDHTTRLWDEALLYCESLSFGQKTDWRLPNVNELHSLATYGKDPELQTTFPDLESDFYWTSTTNANDINNAWIVEFKYGILKPELEKKENTNGIYTICVRNKI